MRIGRSFAWCPECKCWVPSDKLIVEWVTDDDGFRKLIRVCKYCLGEEQLPYNPALKKVGFVYDPYADKTQCIYCDSWDTKTTKEKVICNTCGEKFRRNLE